MKSAYSRKYQALIRALRDLRKERGVTQERLAERLRRPQSFVSKFEKAERRLDVVEYWEIVEALEGEPLRLMGTVMGEAKAGAPKKHR